LIFVLLFVPRDSELDQNLSGDLRKIFSSDLNEIWYVGTGRWVMHDGMPYGQNQGQGHGHKGSRPSVPHGTNFHSWCYGLLLIHKLLLIELYHQAWSVCVLQALEILMYFCVSFISDVCVVLCQNKGAAWPCRAHVGPYKLHWLHWSALCIWNRPSEWLMQ